MVALLAGLSAISVLSTRIILPPFPEIGWQPGVSSRELGLTLSSFFITFALAQLWWGQPLAGRYGRKRLARCFDNRRVASAALPLPRWPVASRRSGRMIRSCLYSLSMMTFLWGLGLADPLGIAITMGPFGREAGLASALLGFLTMSAAADLGIGARTRGTAGAVNAQSRCRPLAARQRVRVNSPFAARGAPGRVPSRPSTC